MKGQIPVDDPVVNSLVSFIIGITVLFMVMGLAIDTQKQAVHQAELEQCQEKFGTDFQNGTMDGSYVCMKDGEVYDPEIHALNVGPTGNILVDMIVVPLSWYGGLPWWIRTPGMILITLILFFIAARGGPR